METLKLILCIAFIFLVFFTGFVIGLVSSKK